MDVTVRSGAADDLGALTEIYNHYVRTSTSTFDDAEFSVEDRRTWFGHYGTTGPHRLLVAESAGAVLGYATASPFRPKPGYRPTVETSAYLDPSAVGNGVGTRLYAALLAILDVEGVHRSVAGIAAPNDASVALHTRFGFIPVGVFTEVGIKLGRFVDVAWYERARP